MANIEALNNVLKNNFIQTDWRIKINGEQFDSNIFKVYPSLTKSTNKMFGDFIMSQCNFELNDRENKLDVLNKEIEIEKLIRINGNNIWYKFGNFIISEIVSDKSALSIKCTAYDKAILFNQKYESNLNFPLKGIDVLNEILEKRKVKLNGTFSFAEFEFPQINYNSETSEREMIARLAELGGEHAIINRQGKLEFRKTNKIDIIINGEHRTEYSLENPDKAIGQVSLGFKNYDDDYIKGENIDGEQTFRIENNPYAELVRDVVIEDIYNNIHGKQARAFSIKGLIGAEFFDINDVFILNDNQGNKHELTILGIKTDGSLRGEIYAEKIEYTSANYKIAGSVKEDLKKVGLEVNHINQTIKTQAEKINDTMKISSRTEQDINGIRTQVSQVEEKNKVIEEKQTNLEQDIDKFKAEVRSSGGSNLLKNSVLFNNELIDKIPVGWHLMLGKQPMGVDNIESLSYGCISGRTISNVNGWFMLQQAVTVSTDEYYSFSIRVKKSIDAYVTVAVLDKVAWGEEMNKAHVYRRYTLSPGIETNFDLYKIEKIKPISNQLVVSIYINDKGGSVDFTDIMLNLGETCIPWNTHTSEAVSAAAIMDSAGLNVKTSNYPGSIKIDGRGLAGYYNGNRSFGTSKDLTWSDKFQAEKEITMPPIKVVPVTSGERAGWSFVKN